MEPVDHLFVRVKYNNEIKFVAFPMNDLKPSTFAYRGMCTHLFSMEIIKF